MADNLHFQNKAFAPLVAILAQDFTTITRFQKQVVTLAVAAGISFLDPLDNATPIADPCFLRNYEKIIDILDDVNVQLSGAIHDKKMDLIFKIEREINHPLVPLRIFRWIKGAIYKTQQLDERMAVANANSQSVPGWKQAELTEWVCNGSVPLRLYG